MKKIRNIAIIAHVDHGKTTLVDALLQQSGVFDEHQAVIEQVMDSNDLERERGITILSKNTAVQYKDYRINIVDTPGHADFGGEVERVLKMVDGVLLIIDAFDGPMPQTRFVLRKTLEKKLQPIVIINKIDRPDARPAEVLDLVYELFIELDATDEQIDFPVLYSSAKNGAAFTELPQEITPELIANSSIEPIFRTIVEKIPEPQGSVDAAFQMLVSNIDYDSYLGRIAIGKIENGFVHNKQEVVIVNHHDPNKKIVGKIGKLMIFQGLERKEITRAEVGEIVAVTGLDHLLIGDTICDPEKPDALSFVKIDEPTISMTFAVNDSPFAGREGEFVTSRHLRARLERETYTNISMQMEETMTTEQFVVKGRGELHLSILIETMRREGYEFQVSKPQIIAKEIDSKLYEPEELVMIDVPNDYSGIVIEKLNQRKAELISMSPPSRGYTRMEFKIPARGLIGYRSEFLTDTRGNGIINSVIDGFMPWKGDIESRNHGVLISYETGIAVTYGLHNAQARGELFISSGTDVYQGQIIGRTMQKEDVTVNVCRRKHATNIRAAGSDDALKLTPQLQFSLEQYLEFVEDDEWIEVTPKNIRIRKKILDHAQRLRTNKAKSS
ncbi:MAG TPA: translational GTPase TypA [Clostridiaceae bacterium]|nr:translational GTPase TypA [Clostridiaceae bacterium]